MEQQLFLFGEKYNEIKNIEPGLQVFAQTGVKDKTQIMIVGDSLSSDILGGNNAGIITCWYNPGHKLPQEGVRIDHEITDLHEIYNLI